MRTMKHKSNYKSLLKNNEKRIQMAQHQSFDQKMIDKNMIDQKNENKNKKNRNENNKLVNNPNRKIQTGK